ncbi:MAG: hypothetical protein ACRCYN_04290 [Plesiomonas sp.]
MDLTAFKTTVDTIKNTLETLHKVVRIKGDITADRAAAEVYSKLNTVQSQLLSLYREYEAVSRSKDTLENELKALKSSAVERSRYELHALPVGSVVYRLKPEHQNAELSHYLCPVCFGNNIKSMLQVGGNENWHTTLRCLRTDCQAVFLHERIAQNAYSVPNRSKRGWEGF